jgi:hypothetical protein
MHGRVWLLLAEDIDKVRDFFEGCIEAGSGVM